MYTNDHLSKLKKCFYEKLDHENTEDQETLNVGLNLFYGNPATTNDAWRSSFRDSIKKKVDSKNHPMQPASPELIKVIPSLDLVKFGQGKWCQIRKELEPFYASLGEVKRTIVYEAPPYQIAFDPNEKNPAFSTSFIFDDDCTSIYANAIRKCFCRTENEKISEILSSSNTGFFDVIPIPIPISSALRRKWATNKKFIIDGKPIFVHFFEWALDNYLNKLDGKFSSKEIHTLAIGIPPINALTLFENYKSEQTFHGTFKFDISIPRDLTIKVVDSGRFAYDYESCIVGNNNYPSGELMKKVLGTNDR